MTDDSSFKRFVFAQSKPTQNCTITAKISFEKNKQCFARFQQKFNMLSTLNIPALLRILNTLLFLSKACSISISGDFLYHMCLAVSVCVCLCPVTGLLCLACTTCVLLGCCVSRKTDLHQATLSLPGHIVTAFQIYLCNTCVKQLHGF